MAKKKTLEVESKKLLATVSGMKIYSDSVYIVTGKMDEGAPDGFQEAGISKTPFPGNKSVTPCGWDRNLHVYDTGFFKQSICYEGFTNSERELEVKQRIENIKEPFEESTGENLDQSNFSFWDSFQVHTYDGRMFYTNDVKDLFDLYIALQSKQLTPKEEDGNPEFQNSMYCVEDKTTAVDIRKQRQLDKADIIYNFMSMLNGEEKDRKVIKDLLLYLDIIHSVEMDPEMIKYTFSNWIESKNTNIDYYKEAYSRFVEENEDGSDNSDIIEMHRIIKEMAYSGLAKVDTTGVSYKNTNLGADFISSAVALINDKKLLDIKADVVEAYNKMKDRQEKIAEGK